MVNKNSLKVGYVALTTIIWFNNILSFAVISPFPTRYNKQFMLMSEIKLPKGLFLPFAPQVYFNGQPNDLPAEPSLHAITPTQMTLQYDPVFSITLPHPPTSPLYILVVLRFHGQSYKADMDSNIIDYLKLDENEPYACFKCDRTFYLGTDKKEELCSWDIERVTLDSSNKKFLKIPHNTIIIIADPEWIDSLSSEEWDARSAVIKLPTITFKPGVKQDDLNQKAPIITLSSLDHKPFHKKRKTSSKVAHPCLVMSMCES